MQRKTVCTSMFLVIFVFLVLGLAPVFSYADDGGAHDLQTEENTIPTIDIEEVRKTSLWLAYGAALFLMVLVAFSLAIRGPSEGTKRVIFILMVATISIPTLYFVGSTIYINVVSETGGPVHWHADFRIFACGEELLPPVPPSFSNKTGTPVLHEHEDRRLHVEGTLIEKGDANLSNFFRVQGGELTQTSFTVPTADGMRHFANGERCGDGSTGFWQVFLYKTEDGRAQQEKLDNFTTYVPSPHINVPPGDCIIFSFGPVEESTEHICDFYQIEINKGDLILKN